VRLLRIQHCPARHDFGLRYLRTDLPAGMAERVEAVLPGPDLAVRTRAAFACGRTRSCASSGERHLTNCGVMGGFHHSPL
jgi:hypothetical protein